MDGNVDAALLVCGEMISFFVQGLPRPQGSKRAFIPRGASRPVVIDVSPALKPWRREVATGAMEARQSAGQVMLEDAVAVSLVFLLPRPRSHLTTLGVLRASSPQWPKGRPDLDKLIRGILDGLTGVIFLDDAQVVEIEAKKVYTLDVPGVVVAVRRIDWPEVHFSARAILEKENVHEE